MHFSQDLSNTFNKRTASFSFLRYLFTVNSLNISAVKSRLVRLCVIVILITLISRPISAFQTEETISINRPIMKGSPNPTGWVQFSTEYVRCFCNLPVCVGSAYMCKSSGGGCFSELLNQVNHALPNGDYKGIHGCLEHLDDRNQRNACENSSSGTSKKNYTRKNRSRSLVLCCYHDMCNHADSPETKLLLNDTVLGATINESDNRVVENMVKQQDTALYTESEVWFRAATIAVPICGLVILLVLIILAVRLLRTESSNSQNQNRKLGLSSYSYTISSDRDENCEKYQPAFQHHNVIHAELFAKDSHHNPVYLNELEDVRIQGYVPLLIRDEIRNIEKYCDRKNETNAKLNFMQELEHCTITSCDDPNIVSQHLFHKNTDIHVGRNMILHENLENNQDVNVDKTYSKESIS